MKMGDSIKEKKEELERKADKAGDLLNEEVQKTSRELDKLIVNYIKKAYKDAD